jgi:hypothetical protein
VPERQNTGVLATYPLTGVTQQPRKSPPGGLKEKERRPQLLLFQHPVRSSWPPSDLLKASLPTGDLERILNSLSNEGGSGYLRLLNEHINDLEPADRKRVSKIIDQVLMSYEHR